jgi:hypothetical protein
MPVSSRSDTTASADFLGPALHRLAQGCTLGEFCDWFAQHFSRQSARFEAPPGAGDTGHDRRLALLMARMIWQRTPDPADGWRQRVVPQLSRNDPCYCGSGRKFKHCCQALAASAPPLDIDPVTLGGGLVAEGPAALREPAALRRIPALMLGAAAHQWGEQKGSAAVVELLEPVFQAPRGLEARHEAAFDLLMDAMLEQALEARREQLARTVAAQASDRRLRATALCRLASMLSDRGEWEQAWQHFHQARQQDADTPQLLHLELTLLLAQGRLEEAKARTPLLAARARKLGVPDLAEVLVQIEQAGPAALQYGYAEADEEELAWADLLRAPLSHFSPQAFDRGNTVREEQGPQGTELVIEPAKPVRRQLGHWRRRFGAAAPSLVVLDASADELLEEPAAALAWLQQRPDLFACLPVLDHLLIAARSMRQQSAAPALRRAAADLAFGAAELVVAACERWPRAQLSWAVEENRPVLRIVAQAIALALSDHEETRAQGWMRWMLARNPQDNHGWREVLRTALLRQGDAQGALELLDAYPADAPPAGHDRALALFMLGHKEEAEAVLHAAHEEFPAFVAALLPATLDRPTDAQAGYVSVGGADQAWYWRSEVRPAWQAAGALEWLRSLNLPAGTRAKVPAKRGAAKSARGRRKTPAPPALASGEDALPPLRRHYGRRLPWVLGWLAGAAWAPAGVMPTAWISPLLQQGQSHADMEGLQSILNALMLQYNRFNAQRLEAVGGEPVPLPAQALAAADDAGWAAFAAAFVEFAETHAKAAWRSAGFAPDPRRGAFAPLYQLAARAPATPSGWVPVTDAGTALLQLVDDPVPARELLARAIEPLWQATLARR